MAIIVGCIPFVLKEIFYSEEKTLNYYLSHLHIAYIDVELNLPQPHGIPII